ncbi:MAG: family 78 glycoside hydrolase catalytic domain [Sedimentisphaerales bacterium]|nr:family 78 glycoside hydrolase catalytic domain [Sedimentisphaerales bacterium]
MIDFEFNAGARWVWSADAGKVRNNYVCFRRGFDIEGDLTAAVLRLTADSRYQVYVNGQWLGHGPVRSWLSPWSVDEYDLGAVLRPGYNVIAVLVQHIGVGTFQYLHSGAGLLGQLEYKDGAGDHCLVTDGGWKCRVHDGFVWPVPRISVQQDWEEQFDARGDLSGLPGWENLAFDDGGWASAVEVGKAGEGDHDKFELRDIPMLTREVVEPERLLAVEGVRPAPYTWYIDPKIVINDEDRMANKTRANVLLVTHVYSEYKQKVRLQDTYGCRPVLEARINGKLCEFELESFERTTSRLGEGCLEKGWNTLMFYVHAPEHYWWLICSMWTESAVKFSARPVDGDEAEVPWLILGGFELHANCTLPWKEDDTQALEIHPEATLARFEEIWQRGTLTDADLAAPFTRVLPWDAIAGADVFARCYSEQVDKKAQVQIENAEALLGDTAEWTTVMPTGDGSDVRFLLDFGREVVGYHEFEIDAPAGTVVDGHNFEFIQRDGHYNLAEGMHNSFGYICRAGVQRYRTWVRRGFRYSWVTLRNFDRPIKIRFVRVIMSTYPVAQRGQFACSDSLLDKIWQAGAHGVRCCAEDTYTDCPTYEQTHWVGDSHNEALVDLVANGDPRLSWHCWVQAGRSLERCDLVECHVPSSWTRVVIPAWTFLWMRWARQHYMLTGDKEAAGEMMEFLDKNFAGIRKYLNGDGLFEFEGWNMFDWAAMDTPCQGVVTHQNCLAVLALRDTAALAEITGNKARAKRWTATADALTKAINKHLWSKKKQAYYDCIHVDGKPSKVFSQQTHTAAYIAGVAKGDRAKRCRAIIEKAPKGFVQAGSPFFMFFLLEALASEGRHDELVDTIRSYWGVQVLEGATTFWETYHPEARRLTRSHCHGWSSAPTFFLTQNVLGVKPLEAGYKKVLVTPAGKDLDWAQGTVPTPRGEIECYWRKAKGEYALTLSLPAGTEARVELPIKGKVVIEAGKAEKSVKKGKTVLKTKAAFLRVKVVG